MNHFELKKIHKDSVASALQKAERYRLLNEPGQAESICLDVLEVEPDNETALVALLLSLTNQFENRPGVTMQRAREVLPKLKDGYQRVYYAGVIAERRALADLHRGGPGAGFAAYEGLREAMGHFEKAEAQRTAGNDDAVLRWNACARLLMSDSQLRPRPADEPWEHATDG